MAFVCLARVFLGSSLLFVSVQTSALSQEGGAGGDEEQTIIVEGRRDVEKARELAEKVAREQASEITRAARSGYPLERLHLPLCPYVVGINEAIASELIERMKSNAISLGIQAGLDDCSKNILVGFVPDVEAEMAALLKNDPWAFGALRRYQRDRVEKETGPTRAWHASIMGDRFGKPKLDLYGEPKVKRSNPSASRIRNMETQLIVGSVVLINRGAVEGKTIQQISDFATFRALAPVNTKNLAIDSILTLFRDDAAPPALTDFDKAYLSAYYSSDTQILSSDQVMSTIGEQYADAQDRED